VLEKDITKYSAKGKVILMGDFNSRTSTGLDLIIDDSNDEHMPLPSSYTNDTKMVERESEDKNIATCKYGKQLLNLCVECSIRIVNGRVIGDMNGKYTCHKYNGRSTVDYVIADETLVPNIQYFKVHDYMGHLSDHCKISFGLAAHLPSYPVTHPQKADSLPPRYKWNEQSAALFKDILSSATKVQELNDLEQLLKDNCNINHQVDTFTNLLNNAAKSCLRQSAKKRRKSSINKPWFNKSCTDLKREVVKLGKALGKDPQNNHLRHNFYSTKKLYRQTLKREKKCYRQQIVDKLQLASENNPKEYWNLLEKLKGLDKTSTSQQSSIEREEWFSHFSNLLKPYELTQRDGEVTSELQMLEKMPVFNELSFRIKQEEMEQAIKKLKNGKSAGPDRILSEMIKVTSDVLVRYLTRLFNTILLQGTYPNSWANGFITPIFKKGDPSNTDNYRGITVGSSLGKLFSLVLHERLSTFCLKHTILDERQIGLKKAARTSDHIFIIKSLFEKHCTKEHKKLYACFIDFRKAFDTVWHEALLLKLLRN
jgi:hypothetical protein